MKKPEKRLPYRTTIHKCVVTMPIDDGALVEPDAFIREGTEYMLSLPPAADQGLSLAHARH